MAKAFIDDTTLTGIADAIRDVNGSSNTYLPSEMPAAISALAPDQEQLVINPSELSQTFKSTNGYANILAEPVSSTYIGSDVTRKTAASYTPTKKPQTISGGQYLTGDQTINPIPDEYIIPVLEPVDVQSTDYVTRIERPPNGVDGFSQITVKGIPEEYIVPSGTKKIYTNDTHDVTSFASVLVNVSVPDGYIKIGDTKTYVTQCKIGAYTPNTTQLISATTIPIGFKPKIFIIRNHSGIAPSSTIYCASSFFVVDNDYNCFSESVSEYSTSTNVNSWSTVQIGSSSISVSQAFSNVFHPYDNGVQGSGTATIYMKKGATYLYYAWG